MKKVVLLAALLPLMLNAQVTYPGSSYAAIGDTFVISSSTTGLGAFNFAQAGANSTWNYATLPISTQETRDVLNPNNAGYFTSFITACIFGGGNPFSCPGQWNSLTDIAFQELDGINLGIAQLGNVVRHYRRNNATLEATVLGVSAGTSGATIPYAAVYEHIDTIYHFPITYLQQDSSDARLDIDLSALGVPYGYRSGQHRVNKVQGWGSLSTPYGTFASTLKMRTEIWRYDTLVANGTATALPLNRTVEYSWFDPAWGAPVLKVSGNIIAGQEVITRVEFIDSLRCVAPNAFFTYSPLLIYLTPGAGVATVDFSNLTNNSADTYFWDFGDGGTSTQEEPTHTYTAAGFYTVQLVACNSYCNPLSLGCDTVTLPLTVLDSTAALSASFTLPASTVCEDASVQFTNTSTGAITYLWSFGDGGVSTQATPSHTYANPGVFTVALIAAGLSGADTSSATITVNPAPQPNLGPDTGLASGLGQSITLLPNAAGMYLWSDGSTGSSLTVNSTNMATGTYTYWVKVTGANGCVGTDTIQIQVAVFLSADDAWKLPALSLQPNPASDAVRLSFVSPPSPASVFEVRLLDLAGRVMVQRVWKGSEELTLSLQNLASGLYLISVEGEGSTKVMKVVKE